MKLNKIFTALAGLALLWGSSACTDEVKYDPTPKYDGDQVFFSPKAPSSIALAEGAETFTFPLQRYEANGELTVGLECSITGPEGAEMTQVFSLPTQITFPADAKEVEVPVGVVFSAVTPDFDYVLNVKVAGEKASPYGATTATFAVSYAPWTDWVKYSDEPGTMTLSAPVNGWYEDLVYTRSSALNPDLVQYKIAGPFEDIPYEYILTVHPEYKVSVDGKEYPLVLMDNIQTSQPWLKDQTDGLICDAVSFFTTPGEMTLEEVLKDYAPKYTPAYFDAEKGLFFINVFLTSTQLVKEYKAAGPNACYLQLPGFANYEIDFTVAGNFVDSEGEESVILNAYKSDDVYAYAYSIEEGELTEAEVEAVADAIAGDPDATLYFESISTIKFVPEKSGKYTVVAVGFDQSNQRIYTTSSVFEFTSVKTEDSFETIGYCLYRDGFVDAFYNIPFVAWEVEVKEDKNNPGYYRLVDPYKEWPLNVSSGGKYVLPGKYYLDVDATDPNYVRVAESEIGVQMDPRYGAFSAWCAGDLILATGKYTEDQIKQAGYYGKMKDGVITFDPGTLVASMSNYKDGAYHNSNIDLDNPANQDGFEGEYDPFWGKNGPFMVDLSDMAPVKAKQQKLPANMQCKEKANKAFVGQKNANAKQGVVVKTLDFNMLINSHK